MTPSLAGRAIAIVTRLYLPEPGAASYRLGALARALRDAGATTTVVTTRAPAAHAVDDPQGIEVRRARVLRDRAGYVRGSFQYLSFDIPAYFRLAFRPRPDLFVVEAPPTTGWMVRVLGNRLGIPYVYYAADVWGDAVLGTNASRLVKRGVSWIEIRAMRDAALVLCVSDEFADRLRELGVGDRIVTIGNGVDTDLFRPEGPRHDLGAPYLLYAGTASEVHGATVFVEALRRLVDRGATPRAVFVGQGAERAEIERLAAGLPAGTVTFLGRLSPEETSTWIRGAAATLASVRPDLYHRAFPTKMYASIACGTRVIYAGTGPGRDFADRPGFGWAVDYDVEQVADAMSAALATPATEAERSTLSTWARENLSLDAVAERATAEIARLLVP